MTRSDDGLVSVPFDAMTSGRSLTIEIRFLLAQVASIGSVLDRLTTQRIVVIIVDMEATLLIRDRIVLSESAFAELVLWQVPEPVSGSSHSFKYRLAYVVNGVCVLRYDNEAGKGDHRHFNDMESGFTFTNPGDLIAVFQADIARWNDENSDT
jgi:Family of unknown function (DUF6516)